VKYQQKNSKALAMAVIDNRNVLKGINVGEAMRRQVIALARTSPVENAIRCTVKYKVNAVLVVDENRSPAGIVSKTDLMGAYYAGLDLDTSVESIMVGNPFSCGPNDPLELALETMQEKRIHRLYVVDPNSGEIIGTLAYPDIVGMLYRFCRRCRKNLLRPRRREKNINVDEHIRAREVMSRTVSSFHEEDSLVTVIEGLSELGFGAVLIHDSKRRPTGVLSKTDLMIAYMRNFSVETPAKKIMNFPVRSCSENEFLVNVIQQMIFSDIHRMFVHGENESNITGILTLTDAARVRSGSCRACLSSRILVGNP
jgi:CBS domain-containing protein